MPLLPDAFEQQGIVPLMWDGILGVGAEPGPKLSMSPDGYSAAMRLYVPYANHQEIMREIVGYSFHKTDTGNFTLYRNLPDIFPYYSNFWAQSIDSPANMPPEFQDNDLGVSSNGYPLYATKVDVLNHLTQIPGGTPPPEGFLYYPPWYDNPGIPQPPWLPDLTYKYTELMISYSTLPYRVCFLGEVPSPPGQDVQHKCPEALRYTSVSVVSTEKLLTGNWGQWVFDPTSGTPPEADLKQVSANVAVPFTTSIVTATWHDVDPACFNQLALDDVGGKTNDQPFYMGIDGITITIVPSGRVTNPATGNRTYARTPYWGFPAGTLAVLGYNCVPTLSPYGQFFTYTVQMQFLYAPFGVNSYYNPTAAIPSPSNYNQIHIRGRSGTNFNPAFNYTRPFLPADFTALFTAP